MRFVRLSLLLLLPCLALRAAAADLALQDGEQLNYRVAWGLFLHAGDISISARSEVRNGVPYTIVTSRTSTRGLLGKLFRFKAEAEAVFDERSGQMVFYTENSASKKKKTHTALVLDYATSTAKFTDFVNPEKSTTVEIPGDSPADLIMTLVQTRTWNLKPKEKRDTDVTFGKDIYQLTVHALRYDKVRTPLGQFNTVVLEPRMEKTPPKGMFRRGSQVHVWIAQDDPRHLPVMFEVEFNFGAGIATLTEYTPPGGSANEADSAATAGAPAAASDATAETDE